MDQANQTKWHKGHDCEVPYLHGSLRCALLPERNFSVAASGHLMCFRMPSSSSSELYEMTTLPEPFFV